MDSRARIVFGYAFAATAWILFSDSLMVAMWPNIEHLKQVSLWKGLAFVATTSLVLHLLLARIGQRERTRNLALFESHPAAMLLIDPHTRAIVDANPSACAFYGWDRRALCEMNITDINTLPPAAVESQVARAMGSKSNVFHFRHRTASGEIRDVEVHSGSVEIDGRSLVYSIIHDETARVNAQQIIGRKENLYAAISEASAEIVRMPDAQRIYEAVCRIAVERTELLFAWVGTLEAGQSEIRPTAIHGQDAGYLAAIRVSADAATPMGRGPSGIVASSGSPYVNNDFLGNPLTAPWHEAAARAGIGSSAAFPIRRGGQLVAILNVYAPHAGYFDREVVELMERLATDVSFALDNDERRRREAQASAALAASEARWRFALTGGGHGVWEWNARTQQVFFSTEWKSMLGYAENEIGNTLDEWSSRVHPDDMPHVQHELDRHLAGDTTSYFSEHRMRCRDGSYRWVEDRGKIMSRDDKGDPLVLIGTHTDITERKTAEQLAQSLSEQMQHYLAFSPIVSYALTFENGAWRPVWVSDNVARLFGYSQQEVLDPGWWAAHLHPEDRDAALAGMQTLTAAGELGHEYRFVRKDGGTIWILDKLRLVSDEQGWPLRAVGAWSDIGVRRKAEATIRDYAVRLEGTLTATVDAMSTMVELRDPYTAGHEQRVAMLAVAIAAEMGLGEELQRGLRVAGAVHDIGKIAVPAEILSKPGQLTDIERQLARFHPEQGYQILRGIPFPWPVAEVAHQHHERMDGSGYPLGLKGDAILLEARIVAVADVVESMLSHRPYRPALGIEAALHEIESHAGAYYDTAVAGACLRLFREKGYVVPTRD
jgi:PAS domain S-box-containing protein